MTLFILSGKNILRGWLSLYRQPLKEYKVYQRPFLFYCIKKQSFLFFFYQQVDFFCNETEYILNVKLVFRWIFTDAVLKVTIHKSRFSSYGISSKLHICLCIHMYILFSFVVKLDSDSRTVFKLTFIFSLLMSTNSFP